MSPRAGRIRIWLAAGILSLVAPGCALLVYSIPPPIYPAFVTPGGVRVQDFLVPESGHRIDVGDEVVMHYTVVLPDGTVLDSSFERGRPITFEFGQGLLAPGIEEGLVGARQGTRRHLVIPPELGADTEHFAGLVEPGTTLLFEVQVLEVHEPHEQVDPDEE